MSARNETKAVVSVAEMARMVGLSRSRFYQLMGTAFPHPVHDLASRRPAYTEELQQVCLEVRKRNCGIDGRPVLFNARRVGAARHRPKAPRPKPEPNGDVSALVEGLNALGLTTTAFQVERATKELFPGGTGGIDRGEVLRAVFLHLKRRNSGDDVKR
jgi:predicted DNA-binding transcriptional regulator AlpA